MIPQTLTIDFLLQKKGEQDERKQKQANNSYTSN